MKLLKTNLSLFAYDKNRNYSAEQKEIIDKAGGEKNLTLKDYEKLAALENEANEKVRDLNAAGENKWGAKETTKWNDIYNSAYTTGARSKSGGNDKDDDVHYTPPSTTTTTGAYTPIDTSGIDWDKMYLSDSQYKQVQAYGQAYMAAFNRGDMEEAERYHNLAEQIRSKAASGIGYSGGGDGSQYLPFPIEEIPEQQMTTDDRWNKAHQLAGLKPTYTASEEIPEQSMTTQELWNTIYDLIDSRPEYTSADPTREQSMTTEDRWNMIMDLIGSRPEYEPIANTLEQMMTPEERWNAVRALVGDRPEYTPWEDTPEQMMNSEERLNAILALAGDAPEFTSRWDETKIALAQAYLDMNYPDFLKTDQYQALEDLYTLQGKNAAQNVLGQIASRTGGLGSSYAGQVANQSYNDYMSRLSAAAYDMYNGELSNAYNKAAAAYGYDDSDYNRYLNDLSQWNKQYANAADAFDKSLAQANYNREWNRSLYESDLAQWNKDYANANDTFNSVLAQQNYNREFDYNMYLNNLSQWNQDYANASNTIDKVLAQQNYNREFDYSNYLNSLAQWNTEHGYATDALQTALSQANYNREWNRGLYESDLSQWNKDYGYAVDALDKSLAQSNYNQEWNYNVSQASKVDAMDRIISYLSTGGLYSDLPDSLIEASGYSPTELKQLQNYYQSMLAPSGGNGGTGYLKPDKPTKEKEPTVTNRNGDSWVTLQGETDRFSWQELYDMVESGEVEEVYDKKNNTLTYKRAPKMYVGPLKNGL